jgi:protein SCO1
MDKLRNKFHMYTLMPVFIMLIMSAGTAGSVEVKDKHYPLLPFAAEFGGAFNLTNHNGVRTTDDVLRGKYSLLYFGFTDCPDICPTALNTVGLALSELAENDKNLTAYFINLNHDDMSAENLAEYVQLFHPNIVGLLGTAADVSNAAAAFGVRYKKIIHADGSFALVHSGKIFLIGPDKKVIAYFPHEANPDWIVSTVSEFYDNGSKE